MARTLAELRDIHLPPVPDSGGLALVGDEWLWGALLAATAVVASGLLWRRRRRRELRLALREIDAAAAAYGNDGDISAFVRNLSRVLRRHAIKRFPRAAGLIGDDWLAFLDAHGCQGFRDGPGALLAELPYRPVVDVGGDTDALLQLVKRWLCSNP